MRAADALADRAPRPRLVARIGDIMTRDPITVEVGASIAEATRVMLESRVGGLPVVYRGLLAGIITQADLVNRLAPRKGGRWWMILTDYERLARECQKARGTTVGEVMTRPAVAVAPDEALEAAVRLLRDHRIGRLPVADHGHLVGIVSHRDLLQALAGAPRRAAVPDRPLAREVGDRGEKAAWN
jgi:CBS domain-containing protein